MENQNKLQFCKNCSEELAGNFCSNCGFPKSLKRIDKKYIINEIGSVLNFDRGIFYTTKELLFRPGKTVRTFILEDRNRLVKPLVFIIVTSLIYTIIQQFFQFEDGYVNFSFNKESTSTKIFEWVTRNYGYSNFLMATFIGLWIKVFYRKYGYNFFEILILLCFAIGMGMLLFAFFGIFDSLISLKIIDKGFLIGVLYIIWAIGQFFEKSKVTSYLKAFSSYFLGLTTFVIGILLFGTLVDYIL
jgi:hypothetical protein